MRTKKHHLNASLGAVGTSAALAQVYSVNVVGYANITVPPGFALIANPLQAADNSVAALLPSVPDGTTIFQFDQATGYTINTALFGSWGDPAMQLVPGEGVFILNPETTDLTLTFVGEVMQGDLSNNIPSGFSIQASQVPQAGQLDTDLEFPAADGDTIYQFNRETQDYDISSYLFGSWTPAPPVIAVGESFFVDKAATVDWTRTFNVE
jgi:hypothetical protein